MRQQRLNAMLPFYIWRIIIQFASFVTCETITKEFNFKYIFYKLCQRYTIREFLGKLLSISSGEILVSNISIHLGVTTK